MWRELYWVSISMQIMIIYLEHCSKSPCLCGNHTFPDKGHHQGLRSMRPQAECFPGSDDALSWEMWDFCTGTGSCFYPLTCKKHQDSHAKIAHFYTPLWIVSWWWDKCLEHMLLTMLEENLTKLHHWSDSSISSLNFKKNKHVENQNMLKIKTFLFSIHSESIMYSLNMFGKVKQEMC